MNPKFTRIHFAECIHSVLYGETVFRSHGALGLEVSHILYNVSYDLSWRRIEQEYRTN